MKGSLRTVRVSEHPSKTNFNDWSDPKCELPPGRTKVFAHDESPEVEEENSNFSIKTVLSDTTLEINNIMEKLRRHQPLMTKKEIRNYRLPFYESLLLNVKEDGYILTHEFIRDLIEIDDAYHKDVEHNYHLKNRPFLKHTESILIPLSEGLIKAETSRLNELKNEEATAFLDLAILFSKADDPSYYWIAREMFEQCMEVMKADEKSINPQLQAVAKYLYGAFLFFELRKMNEAKSHTEAAMVLSEGQSWKIGEQKKPLYIECCTLLHKIYLAMAQRELSRDKIDEAIQMCRNGLLWAKVMTDKPAEADALRKLINIYITAQQLMPVPELLEHFMKLCLELEDYEALCEGYILQARYFDCVGDHFNVTKNMNDLLETAKKHGITKMIAMAHHKLATFCLMQGAYRNLKEHAIEAYLNFLNLKKNMKDAEEARCLVGIAQALEIMTDYCDLVFDADNRSYMEQSLLFNWKNLRIPFFDAKLALITEIETNSKLNNKVEAMRDEEIFSNFVKHQSELMSISSKRFSDVSYLQSKQPTILSMMQPGKKTRYSVSESLYTSREKTTTTSTIGPLEGFETLSGTLRSVSFEVNNRGTVNENCPSPDGNHHGTVTVTPELPKEPSELPHSASAIIEQQNQEH